MDQKKKYCPNCFHQIESDSIECIRCNTKISHNLENFLLPKYKIFTLIGVFGALSVYLLTSSQKSSNDPTLLMGSLCSLTIVIILSAICVWDLIVYTVKSEEIDYSKFSIHDWIKSVKSLPALILFFAFFFILIFILSLYILSNSAINQTLVFSFIFLVFFIVLILVVYHPYRYMMEKSNNWIRGFFSFLFIFALISTIINTVNQSPLTYNYFSLAFVFSLIIVVLLLKCLNLIFHDMTSEKKTNHDDVSIGSSSIWKKDAIPTESSNMNLKTLPNVKKNLDEFRAAHSDLLTELGLNTINWNIFAFLFFILIPFFLYFIQLLILTETIPYPVAIKYFVLTFNDPNFANMFLSNYIHSVFDYNHIYQNVLSSITIFLMIYLYFLFVLPYIKFKIPTFQFRFNPRAFVLTLIVIFCYIPFSISGISIYFGKILGKSIAWGYSGLLYAFLGFFFYLLVQLLVSLTLQKASATIPSPLNTGTDPSPVDAGQEQQGNDYAIQSASLIFSCVFIPFLMIAFILSELIQPGTGVFAHLGGFMLGFLIAPVIEMLTFSRLKKQKIAFCVILTLIVVVPAVFWLGAGRIY